MANRTSGVRHRANGSAELAPVSDEKRPERTSPVLEARGLTKRYGDVTALDALDLDIAPGEVFCLLGANGAGKTTTINLFLNFVQPTSGTAAIDGLDVTLHSLETKRHIAYIPETVTSCIWTTPPSLTAGIW